MPPALSPRMPPLVVCACGHEGVLREILRTGEVAGRAVGQRADEGWVTFDDLPKRLAVTRNGALPKLVVGHHSHVYCVGYHRPSEATKAKEVTRIAPCLPRPRLRGPHRVSCGSRKGMRTTNGSARSPSRGHDAASGRSCSSGSGPDAAILGQRTSSSAPKTNSPGSTSRVIIAVDEHASSINAAS
jgi:hypothetical protein